MVSVITVNYNSGCLLRQCLAGLAEHVHSDHEVIVVDNASTDLSLENLSGQRLKILRQKDNLGFAKACNIGVAHAQGEYFHFLNPDTEVPDGLGQIYDQIGINPRRCIYTTRIEDMEGHSVPSAFAFPTLSNLFWAVVNPKRVAKWHLGASVIVSREVLAEIGGFSEEYFLYSEDVDLFYKAFLAGIPTIELPIGIRHVSGGTSVKVWTPSQRLERVEASALIFARKFGLRFSYFVFKHVAFFRKLPRVPKEAFIELKIYWKGVLLGFDNARQH